MSLFKTPPPGHVTSSNSTSSDASFLNIDSGGEGRSKSKSVIKNTNNNTSNSKRRPGRPRKNLTDDMNINDNTDNNLDMEANLIAHVSKMFQESERMALEREVVLKDEIIKLKSVIQQSENNALVREELLKNDIKKVKDDMLL